MGIDDQLRAGTVTRQQLEELAGRVQALEQNATGDGAAFASVYNIINTEGEVEPVFAQGPEGPEGPEGPQGPEGPAGAKGEKGAEGAKGEKGAKGAEGPEGPQGKEGKEGPAGGGGTSAHGHSNLEIGTETVGHKTIELAFVPTDVLVSLGVANNPEEPFGDGAQDLFVELFESEQFTVYSKAPTSNWVTPFFWLAFG